MTATAMGAGEVADVLGTKALLFFLFTMPPTHRGLALAEHLLQLRRHLLHQRRILRHSREVLGLMRVQVIVLQFKSHRVCVSTSLYMC